MALTGAIDARLHRKQKRAKGDRQPFHLIVVCARAALNKLAQGILFGGATAGIFLRSVEDEALRAGPRSTYIASCTLRMLVDYRYLRKTMLDPINKLTETGPGPQP